MSDHKRIAKNTAFLYIRMILIMAVTLYTSRVILDKLGVEDYALYNVLGGVVGMLSFLNGTLGNGTSRFLTFELGTGNVEKLKKTFSTAFYTHLILACIILVIMETVGLWYVYHKMVIPIERFTACLWVFQISILTTIIAIIQVPYTAIIMAHERMGIYAYIGIFEAFAKLAICYCLTKSDADKLIVYASLLALVQLIVSISYLIYCTHKFNESKLSIVFDKNIFRSMMGFSGWNIIANLAETLKLQGVIVLMNLFFAPFVITAQAIANQVANAMMQFVTSFRLAINPQIIKLYAAGDKGASKRLTLSSTVYCFDLVLLLGLPCIFVADNLLNLWLVEVPEYAVVFTQWIIVIKILGTFSAAFYVPMLAANRIKSNSIASVYIGIGEFVLLYILLKIGFGVMWVQYLGLIMVILFSLVVKPYILYKEIDYTLCELFKCYWDCFKVTLLALVISIPSYYMLDNSLLHSIFLVVIVASSVVLSSYIFMDKDTKEKLYIFIKTKFSKYHK